MSGNTFGGRVAFVTGGGSGIGRATSIRIAKGGGLVAVVDRNLDGANGTVDLIGLAGGRAVAIEADATDEGSVNAAVATTAATFGAPPVILVANA